MRSVEPNGYIDLGKQFYLLPILEFGESGLDQYETRILKLAAAVLQGADARGDQSVINRGKTDVQTRQAMLESERARLQGLDDELARLNKMLINTRLGTTRNRQRSSASDEKSSACRTNCDAEK